MGILFKKREKRTEKLGSPTMLSARLNASSRKVQFALARWLQQRTACFSPFQWKIALVLFILFTGGYNVLLITGSFRSDDPWVLSITGILKPKYLSQTGEEFSNKSLADFEKEFLRIMDRAITLDSLNKSEARKNGLDGTALDWWDGLDLFLEKPVYPENKPELNSHLKQRLWNRKSNHQK